jgi:hypothetical protein
MTTWQSNDDVRRDGGAELAEFDDAPPAPAAEPDVVIASEGESDEAADRRRER